MPSSVVTTYLGYRISIEPFEWGYLAQVVEPTSGRYLVAGNSSAFRALEDAFEAVDGSLEERKLDPSGDTIAGTGSV